MLVKAELGWIFSSWLGDEPIIDHHCKTRSELTDMLKNSPCLLNILQGGEVWNPEVRYLHSSENFNQVVLVSQTLKFLMFEKKTTLHQMMKFHLFAWQYERDGNLRVHNVVSTVPWEVMLGGDRGVFWVAQIQSPKKKS